MSSRAFSIAAVAVTCCVGAPVLALPPIETASIRQLTAGELLDSVVDPTELRQRKTMCGKVLAAIALERVTGRKPDPLRFSDLNY